MKYTVVIKGDGTGTTMVTSSVPKIWKEIEFHFKMNNKLNIEISKKDDSKEFTLPADQYKEEV